MRRSRSGWLMVRVREKVIGFRRYREQKESCIFLWERVLLFFTTRRSWLRYESTAWLAETTAGCIYPRRYGIKE